MLGQGKERRELRRKERNERENVGWKSSFIRIVFLVRDTQWLACKNQNVISPHKPDQLCSSWTGGVSIKRRAARNGFFISICLIFFGIDTIVFLQLHLKRLCNFRKSFFKVLPVRLFMNSTAAGSVSSACPFNTKCAFKPLHEMDALGFDLDHTLVRYKLKPFFRLVSDFLCVAFCKTLLNCEIPLQTLSVMSVLDPWLSHQLSCPKVLLSCRAQNFPIWRSILSERDLVWQGRGKFYKAIS